MNIVVIGGGPAGMMAAGVSGKNGNNVFLLEKNEKLGKKLYITGKGRCNVTNTASNEEFFNNVVNNQKFLYSALHSFNSADTFKFFEELNVPLVKERGGRVFPKSQKSSDIIKAMTGFLVKNNVKTVLNCTVKKIIKKENIFLIETSHGEYEADKVIIATGGLSYQSTGSTGDGYKFSKQFRHKVVPALPALVPIILKNPPALNGLSLKNVCVWVTKNDKMIKSMFGEMLFTDKGVTGPIILSISSFINRTPDLLKLHIDFKPALSSDVLKEKFQNAFTGTKELKTYLNTLLPKRLVDEFITKCGILPNKKINVISGEERNRIIKHLKDFEFNIKGLDSINDAIITSGGVSVDEINPKTMESKLVKGLFFAGEIIDVDALTGGYNIQIALSTGYVAGS